MKDRDIFNDIKKAYDEEKYSFSQDTKENIFNTFGVALEDEWGAGFNFSKIAAADEASQEDLENDFNVLSPQTTRDGRFTIWGSKSESDKGGKVTLQLNFDGKQEFVDEELKIGNPVSNDILIKGYVNSNCQIVEIIHDWVAFRKSFSKFFRVDIL